MGTSATTGNDNTIIDHCDINAGGVVYNGIYSAGSTTTTAANNSGVQITNNYIHDYFGATVSTDGINIGTGNNTWTITGNLLYQTATRVYTSANTHYGINIAAGDGYTVNTNKIGYANSSSTGTYNIIGNTVTLAGFPASYVTTGTANGTKFVGINAGFTAAGVVSNIQGNTIANIAMYTNANTSTATGIFCGIAVNSGNANVGTTAGNTIGSTATTGSIYTAAITNSGGAVVGIYAASVNTVTIKNNTIAGIDAMGTTALLSGAITGINTTGSGTYDIEGNTIGNSTPTKILQAL